MLVASTSSGSLALSSADAGSSGVSRAVSLVSGDSGSMSFSTGVGSSGVGAEIFPLLYKFW